LTEKQNVFIRDATGLVKNVSFLNAVSMNVANMAAGAALASIGLTMVLLPSSVSGVNLVYASIFAFLLSIPQLIVYTRMTNRLPRTGGDYVWTSRMLGGPTGTVMSFMGYTLSTMTFLALIALSTVFAIGSVAVAEGYQSFLGLALPGNTLGANPLMQFLLAAFVFGVLIAVNIFRPRAGYRLVSIFAVFGIVSLIVAISSLLIGGNSAVVSYMDFLNSTQTSSSITYASVAGSYQGSSFSLGGTIFLLPFFAYFVFTFLNASPSVGSEIKGRNTLKWNLPASAAIVFVILTASFGVMYYVGGFRFIDAALTNPTLVYNYSFNFWTLAMGVSTNAIISWIIGLGWIVWDIAILANGIIVISRYIFGQSFDRFLPTALAYVSPKYNSPAIAHLIDLVITVSLIGAASFLYGTFSSLFGAVIAAMIYFAIVGIAAFLYAKRFEKGTAKYVLGVCGVLMTIIFIYLVYAFAANPAVWGGNYLSYGYVLGSFVGGVVIYAVSKSYHSRRGLDIGLVFKQIPPE
jgi:amino acid transporter